MSVAVAPSGLAQGQAGLTDKDRHLPPPQAARLRESLSGKRIAIASEPGVFVQVTYRGYGPIPVWLEPTLRRLERLAALQRGWDSYSARQIPAKVIVQAISVLGLVMDTDSPAPETIPAKRGGIRYEWHNGSRDLEITVTADEAQVFYADDQTGASWEGNLSDLLQPTREVLPSFEP